MKPDKEKTLNEFYKLVEIMAVLRSENGCSWDRKQTHESLAENVIEEAQEVADAIKSGDELHMKEELGDLLMMVVFHAQIALEAGKFDMGDVARGICDKLVLRHPHVFGNAEQLADPDQVMEMWGKIKKKEKLDRAKLSNRMIEAMGFASALAGAEKIQIEAARAGFDFPSVEAACVKISEETKEIENALLEGNKSEIASEIGDLIFSILNVSRLSGLSAEDCLRASSQKFVNRFAKVEEMVEADGGFAGKDLATLDKYWDKIKLEEKG